jgi:hypothetical protein
VGRFSSSTQVFFSIIRPRTSAGPQFLMSIFLYVRRHFVLRLIT